MRTLRPMLLLSLVLFVLAPKGTVAATRAPRAATEQVTAPATPLPSAGAFAFVTEWGAFNGTTIAKIDPATDHDERHADRR